MKNLLEIFSGIAIIALVLIISKINVINYTVFERL